MPNTCDTRTVIVTSAIGVSVGVAVSVGSALYAELQSPYQRGITIGIFVGLLCFRNVVLHWVGPTDSQFLIRFCGLAAVLGGAIGALMGNASGALFGTTAAIFFAFMVWVCAIRKRNTDENELHARCICAGKSSRPVERMVLTLSGILTVIISAICIEQQFYGPFIFPSEASSVHFVAIWESVTLVFQRSDPIRGLKLWQVTVPYWYAIPLSASPGAVIYIRRKLRQYRSRKRGQRGECKSCGYALSGLPIDRCPECWLCFESDAPKVEAGSRIHIDNEPKR